MKDIKIYSFEVCPYCERAKLLLQALGCEYAEEVITREDLKSLAETTGMQTVPQIFVGDQLIGGFDDLNKAVESGEFQQIIKL